MGCNEIQEEHSLLNGELETVIESNVTTSSSEKCYHCFSYNDINKIISINPIGNLK